MNADNLKKASLVSAAAAATVTADIGECPTVASLVKGIENAQEAVRESGAEATVEKITDINEITGFGVLMTPALAVDGEVKVTGRVPNVDEIKGWLA